MAQAAFSSFSPQHPRPQRERYAAMVHDNPGHCAASGAFAPDSAEPLQFADQSVTTNGGASLSGQGHTDLLPET